MTSISDENTFKAIVMRQSPSYQGMGTIVDIVTNAMTRVGRYNGMSGRKKKKFVLECVEGLLDSEEYKVLLPIITELIDALIKVENGKLVFNRKLKKCCIIS